jgi:hypothetical protein
MTLRCRVDELLMRAELAADGLVVHDGDECFVMELAEAGYYELVSATRQELARLERASFRMLRFASDFTVAACR